MADPKQQVKFIKLAPLSLRKDYDDNAGEKDYGTLSWGIRAGYPRIMVYTSNGKKKAPDAKFDYNSFITAPFDYVTFGILMERFDKVISNPTEVNYTIDCFNNTFENGVRTDNLYLQAKVHIGRDKEGVIYIAAIEENKRKLKFYFMPSDKYFIIYDKDSNIVTDKSVLSSLYARSYYDLLKLVMGKEAYTDIVKQNPVVTAVKVAEPIATNTTTANNIDFTSSIDELI